MNTVELASKILTQLGFSQEPSKELGVDDRRDRIVNLIEEYTHPVELTDEEIEQVRIAIMDVAYWCADENMPEAYNAVKVCCSQVLQILEKAQ